MVVIVADAILEARRRTGRLDAPNEAFIGQEGEGVIHRLERNRTDLGPGGHCHVVCRDVGLTRHRAPNRQSLRGDLNPALTKKFGQVPHHLTIE
jgi:hypothetical protein